MSEEMQTNNTIKRKRAGVSMGEWERLTIRDGDSICILTEKDLLEMDGKIAEMQTLKVENARLQQQLVQENEGEKNALLKVERLEKNMAVVERENLQFANEIERLKSENRRLEESYKALNIEYGKLKVFKENAGRGRQNVLTPSQVGQIRAQALEGWSVRQSHESLLDEGVEVSYETVRKVVAEMSPKNSPQPVQNRSESFVGNVPIVGQVNIFGTAANDSEGEKKPMPTISADFRTRD